MWELFIFAQCPGWFSSSSPPFFLSLIENTHPVHHARLINLIDIPGIAWQLFFDAFRLRWSGGCVSLFLRRRDTIPPASFDKSRNTEKGGWPVCVDVHVTCLEYDSITPCFLPPYRPSSNTPHTHPHTSMTTARTSIPHAPFLDPTTTPSWMVRRVNNMRSFPDVTRGRRGG